MDLRRLDYFVAVAEELHFGRAAARLHMAQPPLSQQIRNLEEDLGLTLFERTTRRVTLTPAGTLLLGEARELLAAAQSTSRIMEDFRSGHHGTLRLGFVDTAAYQFMPQLLHDYRAAWPTIGFELTSMSSDEQHVALTAGRIDLGICRSRPKKVADIRVKEFVHERLFVAVNSSHRLAGIPETTIAALADEPFIGFDRRVSPSLHAELVGMFSAHQVHYDPIIEATEYATILGLVGAGEGISIVPECVQSFQPPNLHYLPIRDPEATLAMLMIARDKPQTPLVENAFRLVSEMFPLSPEGQPSPRR